MNYVDIAKSLLRIASFKLKELEVRSRTMTQLNCTNVTPSISDISKNYAELLSRYTLLSNSLEKHDQYLVSSPESDSIMINEIIQNIANLNEVISRINNRTIPTLHDRDHHPYSSAYIETSPFEKVEIDEFENPDDLEYLDDDSVYYHGIIR